jgi:tRNA G18 (ribose-2'-O)-methylase SpoU
VPRGGEHPDDLPAGVAIVLGGEAAGLDAGALALCDLAVTVPAPGFESLNVAAAAAILAWHLA